MGIQGIYKEIGPGQRVSLAKLAHDHYVAHNRPFRLAIDIAIWLFQIQAGKGGSNPALRTFYYRLLRLLTLNIQPLFVFDGPNKPLFKRNKRVGGPGVRVASVPEFLAKQLLKQFGFPWHIAPGEGEAECALLQREGIVDAVLSEDVDTLMFGSGVSLRNWSSENSGKTPTHVNQYRASDTKEKSGLDREGMVLVALMSGGDYIPEGIPRCGIRLACDAAKAGFGKDLCALMRAKDTTGLKLWREKLQHEMQTNESKIFSRKNSKLVIPDDFPNLEILGYYTHPCLSTAEKLARLKESLHWDQDIDFPALRTFTSEAFEWYCLGGAKKFIKNLAPAMLVRELRLRGDVTAQLDPHAQKEREKEMVVAVHGERRHSSTDGELEYRISFIPAKLVPIDLSIEEEDDDTTSTGFADDQSDGEMDCQVLPTDDHEGASVPASPSKKRTLRPYFPDQPEKLWVFRDYLKVGCPLMVEDYEAPISDPMEAVRARRKAKAVPASGAVNAPAQRSRRKSNADVRPNKTILAYTSITKTTKDQGEALSEEARGNCHLGQQQHQANEICGTASSSAPTGFRFRSTQITVTAGTSGRHPQRDLERTPTAKRTTTLIVDQSRPFAAFAKTSSVNADLQKTPPRRKRPSRDPVSPAVSQRTIDSYLTLSPAKKADDESHVIDLTTSPIGQALPRPTIANLTDTQTRFRRNSDAAIHESADFSPGKLPNTVTKRRKKAPLKRSQTAPVHGEEDAMPLPLLDLHPSRLNARARVPVELSDVCDASPARSDDSLPELTSFVATFSVPQPTLSCAASALSQPPNAAPIRLAAAVLSQGSTPVDLTASMHASLGRPPRQKVIKRRLQLRESLQGSWREIEAETIDLSGDGSGWKASQGRAALTGWRKSGVDVLDLTGA